MPLAAAVVLDFWFGTSNLSAVPPADVRRRWFAGGPGFDAQIGAEFAALLAHPDMVLDWVGTLPGSLAAIVVLDQFPRNVYRGTARAFGTDPLALEVASSVLDRQLDTLAGLHQRLFLYLPFEHAEDRAMQDRAVALCTRLLEDAPPEQAGDARLYLRFALEHQAVFRRFGRFPRRNRSLGRTDTAEEAAWMVEGGPGWGQG